MSVEITYNERGFPQFGEEVATQYGHKVRVASSSAAMYDAAWLWVDCKESVTKPAAAGGVIGVHMDMEQATAIRNRLSAWINQINGYDDSDTTALRVEIEDLKNQLRALADQLEPWRTHE